MGSTDLLKCICHRTVTHPYRHFRSIIIESKMNNIMATTATIIACIAALLSVIYFNTASASFLRPVQLWSSTTGNEQQDIIAEDIGLASSWNVIEHLGGNSPWITKINGTASFDISPPHGCQIEQVHIVC